MKKPTRTSSRRRFVQSTAATAAIAPFFIGRAKASPAGVDLENVIVADFATVAPKDTPWSKLIRKIQRLVKKATDGRLKMRVFLGGGKGDELATVSQCKQGNIAAVGASIGALATQVPEIGGLELPYLFRSSKQAEKVMSACRQQMHDLLWDRGFKLTALSENGFRCIGCTHAIEKLADLKGAKMRSQQSDVHVAFWKSVGANPVTISVPEVFSAVQTGVVEGFDNTALFTFATSWYMAITHFTVTNHIYQPAAVVWSRKFWESLPADIQAAIEPNNEDFHKLESRGFRDLRLMGPQLLDNFRLVGKEVIIPDDAAIAEFKRATAPTHDEFIKGTTDAGRALMRAIKAEL